MAWWLLALGVPQLFRKLQLGAQKVDEFGFKVFLGVLQPTQRQREGLCSAPVTSQPCFPLSGARQSLPSHSSSAKAAQHPGCPNPLKTQNHSVPSNPSLQTRAQTTTVPLPPHPQGCLGPGSSERLLQLWCKSCFSSGRAGADVGGR